MTSSLIGFTERSLPSAADAAAAAAGFHRFAVEAWTLLAVGVLVTVFRTYVRITTVGVRKLTWDDFLVWAGVVSYSLLWHYAAYCSVSWFTSHFVIVTRRV